METNHPICLTYKSKLVKKIIYLIGLVLALESNAQLDYLVTVSNDTIYGDISLIQNLVYDEAIIKTNEGKQVYKSYRVDHLVYKDQKYINLMYNGKQMFAVEKTVGLVSLYLIRFKDEFEFANKLVKKKSGETILVPNLGFKKKMGAFFSDCQSLSNDIKEGKLKSMTSQQSLIFTTMIVLVRYQRKITFIPKPKP